MPVIAYAAPYAALVMDARTGEVLHTENADTRLHPASLTKMMTLYIAFEAIERGEITLDTRITVSKHAAAEPPSKLGLKPGQKIALRYLIRAAAIKSANDAATAIGEGIAGSEAAFARRMNRTAKALGMTRTTFRNAHGLTEEGHMSTARDMTLLGRRLFYDYPQYYNIFSRRSADAGVAQVASTNRRFLDSYEGADGIKTGYTSAAGFNLTASAQRGKKRIIATVFGGRSTAQRNAQMVQLLDIGFGKAPNRALVQKPAAPHYVAEAEPAPSMPGTESAQVAKGKTIRLIMAVATSPRPKPRPGAPVPAPEEVLVAMRQDIDSVLAEVQGAPAPEAAAAPEPAVAEAAPETRPEVKPEPKPEPAPILIAGSEPQPETLALAAAAPEAEAEAENVPAPPADAIAAALAIALAEPEPAPQPEAEAPVVLAAAARAAPPRRPETLVAAAPEAAPEPAPAETPAEPAPVLVAGTEPRPETLALAAAAPAPARPETPETAATVVTETEPQPETLALAALPAPEAGAVALMQTTAPQPETLALAAAPAQPAIAPPPARPEEIVLAMARPEDQPEAELEVVTRVSSSGGRHWGINVGTYGSRYEAERVLLKTALAEMSTLEDSLRKVVNRKGGFDANFVGMSQETAELACSRLAARGGDCKVVGP